MIGQRGRRKDGINNFIKKFQDLPCIYEKEFDKSALFHNKWDRILSKYDMRAFAEIKKEKTGRLGGKRVFFRFKTLEAINHLQKLLNENGDVCFFNIPKIDLEKKHQIIASKNKYELVCMLREERKKPFFDISEYLEEMILEKLLRFFNGDAWEMADYISINGAGNEHLI